MCVFFLVFDAEMLAGTLCFADVFLRGSLEGKFLFVLACFCVGGRGCVVLGSFVAMVEIFRGMFIDSLGLLGLAGGVELMIGEVGSARLRSSSVKFSWKVLVPCIMSIWDIIPARMSSGLVWCIAVLFICLDFCLSTADILSIEGE